MGARVLVLVVSVLISMVHEKAHKLTACTDAWDKPSPSKKQIDEATDLAISVSATLNVLEKQSRGNKRSRTPSLQSNDDEGDTKVARLAIGTQIIDADK